MLILGIESSCDETAASICNDGVIVSNVVRTQEIHRNFGGVVPEIASREHDSHINYIVERSLENAESTLHDIDAIAVTYGPGLAGALLVGVNYAKGLSIGLNIPLIGINHLEGHLYSNFISFPDIAYPYICLLVTGGHTQIWEVKRAGEYLLHSTTLDDAAGEAFDKGARILGLGYPGGPEIEKYATSGNPLSYSFTIPLIKDNPLNFSFSGIKTALLYKIQDMENKEKEKNLKNIAASFQEVIIDTLIDRLVKVIKNTGISRISITGGVAANKHFRSKIDLHAKKLNVDVYFPSLEYCTDNAAMIALAGYYKLKDGQISALNLSVNPNLRLDETVNL